MGRAVSSPAVGLLLDLDPDLGIGIGPEEWQLARWASKCELAVSAGGVWDLQALANGREGLVGLMIVDGLLVRELALGDRYTFELLGPGDVLQPPVAATSPQLGASTRLTAAAGTVLAVLDWRFTRAAARWPSLLATVQRRLEAQRQRLAIQGLIAHFPRAEDRLLLALWHLAENWGRVTPEGTVLHLHLTHDLLGQLTGARRSTATLAVRALEAEGYIRRAHDGSWLLTAAAERQVKVIATATSTGHLLGETFISRQRIAPLTRTPGALRAGQRRPHASGAPAAPNGRPADRRHSVPSERTAPPIAASR